MKHLSIVEHERVRIAEEGEETGLGEDGIAYIERRHFERLRKFDEKQSKNEEGKQIFTFHSKWVKARNWVGVVQVHGLCVEVLPKIAPKNELRDAVGARDFIGICRKNLLYMLSIGRDPLFRERDIASLDARVSPLSEKLIEIFATRLEEALLTGLPRHYTRRQENLRRLKGKLKFSQHVARNAANQARFFVQFDEFTPDNMMNRIFKACCRLLLRKVTSPKTQEKLRHCVLLLDDVDDVHVTLEDFKQISLTRQNKRFHQVFNFCMLIVSQQSPTAGAGKHDTFTLLFDMNAVFEEFVTAFYSKKVLPQLSDTDGRIELRPQGTGAERRYLLSYGKRDEKRLMLKPDLLFEMSRESEKESVFTVMDTKWKKIELKTSGPVVKGSDYYQMYAYAKQYGSQRNVLLFPTPWAPDEDERERVHTYKFMQQEQVGDDVMLVCFVNLNRDLRKDWQKLADELTDFLHGPSQEVEVAG